MNNRNTIPDLWRIPVLVTWFLIAAAYLVIFLIDIRLDIMQIGVPCSGETCNPAALSLAEFSALADLKIPVSFYIGYVITLPLITIVIYLTVALIILWRMGNQWIGIVISFFLVSIPVVILGDFGDVAAIYPQFGWLLALLSFIGFTSAFLFILLFPDGRFVPSWGKWLLLVWALIEIPTSLQLMGVVSISPFLDFASLGTSLIIFILSFSMQIYRYRKVSGPVERQQSKWVVMGFLSYFLGLIGFVAVYGVLQPEPGMPRLLVTTIGLLLIILIYTVFPITLAVSILKYRLWDINQLIGRVLVFFTVSILLLVLFGGIIVLMQSLFTTLTGQTSPLALVISTLAIAGIFNPLRNRVQEIVNRRFYRNKFDTRRALEEFSNTTRNEVDLNRINSVLIRIVSDAFHPGSVNLMMSNSSFPDQGKRRSR